MNKFVIFTFFAISGFASLIFSPQPSIEMRADPACCPSKAQPFQISFQAPKEEARPKHKHGRGRKAPPNEKEKIANSWRKHAYHLEKMPHASAPTYDCRALGLVPPIVNQGQCGSCVPPGTLILMADGSQKTIEKVKIDDWCRTAEGTARRVSAVMWQPYDGEIDGILVDGREIWATPDHLVLTKRGYIAIGKLGKTDMVSSRAGWVQISQIMSPKSLKGPVYDLEVGCEHSYVGNGTGLHNCWCFSGTGVAESALIKAGQLKNDGSGALSEQYTLDCGKNGGCDGDDNTTVLAWAKTTGLPLTSDYGPYTGTAGTCNYKPSMKLYLIQDTGYVGPSDGVTDTQLIKDAMQKYGPLGCAVAAGGTDFWDSGKGTDTGTSTEIDHDVILVAWDDTHDNGDGTKGAFVMRNSWGTSWGDVCANSANPNPTEAGYGWMKYKADSIGTSAVWAVATGGPVPPPAPLTVEISPQTTTPGGTVSWPNPVSGGTAPYSQSWTYGDGSTGTTPSHTYTTTGIYTVSVGVSDSSTPPQKASGTSTVTVGAVPPTPTNSITLIGPKGDTLTIPVPTGWVVQGATPSGGSPAAVKADLTAAGINPQLVADIVLLLEDLLALSKKKEPKKENKINQGSEDLNGLLSVDKNRVCSLTTSSGAQYLLIALEEDIHKKLLSFDKKNVEVIGHVWPYSPTRINVVDVKPYLPPEPKK